MGLSTRLWTHLAKGGRRDFAVLGTTKISYAEMARGVQHWLAAFDAAGLEPGARVVLRTARDEVAIAAMLAGLVDGIVPVLLEGTCPDARLAGIADTVQPGLVASDAPLPRLGGGIVARHLSPPGPRGGLRGLLGGSGAASGRAAGGGFGIDLPAAARAPRLPEHDGLAYILFTSGTTSAPAGVQITRANLAANLATLTRLFDYDPDARIFNDMILAHADGMIQGPILAAWTNAAVIRAGGFDVQRIEDWLAHIRQHRASHVLTVPTVWAMIDRYAAHDDYFDAPECRMLMTVADRMPGALWDRIETRFGRPLFNHYGLTETVASALYAGPHPDMGQRGTIGRPVDCAARIDGDAPEGELLLRGDNIFPGYWQAPDRTAASFTDDGWFKTGDLVRQTPAGSFEMLGRLKTAILSGGVLIRPEEVDEALLRHDAVLESQTVGVEDPVFGEIVMTGVVLSHPVDEAALIAHLHPLLEPRKLPRRIVALDAIPRGPSGKTRRPALRALLARPDRADDSAADIDGDVAQRVLALAAKVFRVPVETLSDRTDPDDVAGWDSFTQLNLVLTLEQQFNRRIPPARVSALRTLGDFIACLGAPE